MSIDAPITDQWRQALLDWSNTMVQNCQALNLPQSLKQSARIVESLTNPLVSYRQTFDMHRNLYDRLIDELQERVTLQIDGARSALYRDRAPFGQDVYDAFPSAEFDIAEAAICLSLDRGTACVMHLCRIVEVGLGALAVNRLNLPKRPNWGQQLNEIERELTARYKTSGVRTAEGLFLSEAAAQIGHIKTAWRNPTMHVDRRYTNEQAGEIFAAVKCFMKLLATRVKE